VRAYRVFNGLGRSVDLEWTVMGQRYRFWSMTAVIAVIAIIIALMVAISPFVAAPVGAAGLAAVLVLTARLNAIDPEGYLREITQLKLLRCAATRPVISNVRNHRTTGPDRITNTGRR
jgi:hypothetical protein